MTVPVDDIHRVDHGALCSVPSVLRQDVTAGELGGRRRSDNTGLPQDISPLDLGAHRIRPCREWSERRLARLAVLPQSIVSQACLRFSHDGCLTLRWRRAGVPTWATSGKCACQSGEKLLGAFLDAD